MYWFKSKMFSFLGWQVSIVSKKTVPYLDLVVGGALLFHHRGGVLRSSCVAQKKKKTAHLLVFSTLVN
jgi:hypothetical protein